LYKDGQPYTDVTPTINGDKITITNLPCGEYTLNATTAGDDNHNSSWDTCKIIVNPAGSEVIVPTKEVEYGIPVVLDISGENTTGISEVEIYRDGQKVDVTPIWDGKKVTVSGLDVGEYTVKVTNTVDGNHVQNTGEGKITVTPTDSEVTVEDKTVVYGNPVTITVGGENTTQIDNFVILDKYGKPVKDYTRSIDGLKITVSGLDVGEYTVRVTNKVDGNHIQSTGEGTITVTKALSSVDMEDVVINHGDDVNAQAATENATGITFVVLKDATPITNGEGVGSGDSYDVIIKDLEPGEYTLNVTTEVDEDHESVTKDFKITVNPVVDLEVKVSVDKTKIKTGEMVTYTITVINHGPNDATDVVVKDKGLTQFEYVTSSSDDYDHNDGTWAVGNLTNQSSAVLTVTVIINKAGTYSNSASVSSNETDSDMSNNNASSDDVEVNDAREPDVDPVPEEPEEDTTVDTVKSEEIEAPVSYETGNPIFMLLMVLLSAILIPLRRRE